MRSRKELLAKRRELQKEWDKLAADSKKPKDAKFTSGAIKSFNNLLRGTQIPAQISLLDWVLNKPTKKQLKAEAMMKKPQKNKNG